MGRLRNAVVLVALLTVHAYAETDIELADKLFAEGIALRDVNLEQSCNKFELSLEKNPQAIGTLLNVALCDEKLGRIAAAYERFSEARDRAKNDNLPDYVAEAQTHIDTLGPELPYVDITFVGNKHPGTKVLIGDRVVPDDKMKKFPVNPGELVIVVSAPGRLAYETKMMIGKRETKPIQVPELKQGVTVTKSSRRTIGIFTTIGGGVAVGVAIGLGLYANNLYDRQFDMPAETGCVEVDGGSAVCQAGAQTETERARTIGVIGSVLGGVGLAVTGVGLYLWLSAPDDEVREPQKFGIVPMVTPESAGLTAIGRF